MADAGGLAVRGVDDGNGNGDVGGESDEELVEDGTGSDDELVVFKRRFNPSLLSRLLTKPRGTPRPAPLSGPAGPHHARKAVPRFDLRLLPAAARRVPSSSHSSKPAQEGHQRIYIHI